jgi:diaminopimelate epimerase
MGAICCAWTFGRAVRGPTIDRVNRIHFVKGHGTENDFVLIPDPDAGVELSTSAVAAICDRRAGIGADGVLRVVRAAKHPEGAAYAGEAEWFMDYRNADGSVAEMCGNGVRVFARYLVDAGLAAAGELPVATRAGVKRVRLGADGGVTADMGPASFAEPDVEIRAGSRAWPATGVSMGNPHAVVFVDDLADAGELTRAPVVEPAGAFPSGVNVEFVVVRGPGHVAMRVHERGSGETRSCGTGACAVMAVAARRDGRVPEREGSDVAYTVDVPGGRLTVTQRVDGHLELAGPAVLVATGELRGDWLPDG